MQKYTYESITTERDTTFVLRSDGAHIPADDSNSDYQRYLRWLEDPTAEDEAQSL